LYPLICRYSLQLLR